MPADNSTSFDDAPLKRACCGAWGKECAPDSLRRRLAALAEQEAPARTIRPPAAFWQRPFAGVAAAAVLLLVSGAALLHNESNSTLASINPQLAADLVSRHDACCGAHAGHQLVSVPRNDMPLLGQALSKALHRPVLVASLPESGWSFRGGTICPVGKVLSGHLIFDHGKESVSIFSLPRWEMPLDARYEAVVDHHPIAGFADSRGVFCLVGSGDPKLTADHLARLRDEMQESIVSAADINARPAFASAELLH
jgi:hypothetical protein